MQWAVEIKVCGPVKSKSWTNLGWLWTFSLQSLGAEIDEEGMCSFGMSMWGSGCEWISEIDTAFLEDQLDFTFRLCSQTSREQTGKQANSLTFPP